MYSEFAVTRAVLFTNSGLGVLQVSDNLAPNEPSEQAEVTDVTTRITSTEKVSTYSYDELPYPSYPFEASHPDHIYSMARLFNLTAVRPDESSILELGCASGGNLIPLALQMPSARCVGVDLSSKQIADGQQTIESLKLRNIQLIAQDFQQIDASFGQFDYIVCHGVFSWVPAAAQHRILEICRERLAPEGVAYISYNAYPGWFMRGMIRQMMLHHTKNFPDAISKAQQARALLSFLVDSTEGQNTPYVNFLRQELEMLGKHPDAYLFHDHLEENNLPLFFFQFMELARKYDLQFLGESSLASMITTNLPPKAAEALTRLTNDIHQRSQYTDFVTNRMFRQSLVCRRGAKVNRQLDPARLEGGYFSGNIRVENQELGQDLAPDVEVAFRCANGRRLQTKHSALKALVFTLADAWPRSLSIPEICESIKSRLSELIVVGPREQVSIANLVSVNLLQMMVRGDIEFRFVPDRFTTNASERPMVSSLNRLQARTGKPLTTQRHGMLNADPLTRLIIQVLDGTRSKEQIVEYMVELTAAGKINVNVEGRPPADLRLVHRVAVDKVLEQLRRSAILVPAGREGS